MTYYKYTKNQYIEKCIRYGVYGSKLEDVNDPFEWEGIVHKDNYRIFCLTTSNRKMLLWAYYNNHRGCCVEYKFSDVIVDNILKNVNYSNDYFNHRYMTEQQFENSLYSKAKEWEDESEIRAVWHRSDDKKIWVNIDNDIYLKGRVVSVTFGLLAEKDNGYLDALKCIREYNKVSEEQIKVKKLILSNQRYELLIDQQYDYESVIKEMDS